MSSKIVFITGASSGLGEAAAKQLASEGYSLILAARRTERLQQLADELLQRYGTICYCMELDVRQRGKVQQLISQLPEKWKKIDILINNAGLASGLSSIENGDIDDWDLMIDTNLKGLLYVTRHILTLMIENGGGHVINISSIAGKEVYANGNVYCATKHAVDALNKAMRIELVKYPIKVTAINPGAVETEFSIVRFHGDKERAKKVYEGFDNLVAGDIAEAISFILSRPAHVNINELTIMPTAQAVAGVIHRK